MDDPLGELTMNDGMRKSPVPWSLYSRERLPLPVSAGPRSKDLGGRTGDVARELQAELPIEVDCRRYGERGNFGGESSVDVRELSEWTLSLAGERGGSLSSAATSRKALHASSVAAWSLLSISPKTLSIDMMRSLRFFMRMRWIVSGSLTDRWRPAARFCLQISCSSSRVSACICDGRLSMENLLAMRFSNDKADSYNT
jgi:hypothetical protein